MLADGSLRKVLSRRDFRRLLAVRLSSQFGDGLFQAGIGGSVLFNPQQHTTPLEIATGFAILLLPYSLIGPYVGVFLDRWSRRNILVTANLTRAVLTLPAAALVWSGHAAEIPFALLALLIIAINRFFLADMSASMPHVTDDERLATGNAVSNTLGTVAYSAGLATAIALLSVLGAGFHGYGLIVLTALFGYGASSVLARVFFDRMALGPDDATRVHVSVPAALSLAGQGMIAGVRHLASRPVALHALLAQGCARGLYGVLTIATLLFAKTLDNGTRFLGLAFGAGAIGALVAAGVTPMATRRWGGQRWLLTLLVIDAATIAVLGLTFQQWRMVAAVFFLNVASMGMKIVVDTALQHECADEYQGRVFSVNDTAFNAVYIIGLFIGAYLLPVDGHSLAIMIGIVLGYGLLATWYYGATRRRA